MRILIAEDEGLIRMDLRELLIEQGHEIIGEARDGEEALALAQRTEPDLCFLDISMPKLDGLEVAEALAKLQGEAGPRFPIVMLTAFSGTHQIERARDAGVYGYVVKPFTKADIVPALEVARARFEQESRVRAEANSLAAQLETRKLLDRAKAILMARGQSEADAFSKLQHLAMDKRKTLREIAEAIILSDEIG